MRPGEEITCPHCGKSSFLRKESVMEGWTKKGEILVCSACGKKVCDLEAECAFSGGRSPLENKASSSLLSLLGEESFEKKVTLSEEGVERRFCKDCAFLIVHPFASRCSLTDKVVDPMGDCDSFRRKENA